MPTALDNGQRSPRKLLGAVLGRLVGGKSGDETERVAVVATLVLDKVAASSPYSAELAKRAAAAEMQAAREMELPFARAKLERLIESRAIVLAEAMYEERKALDLAAVKAELADTSDPPGGPR